MATREHRALAAAVLNDAATALETDPAIRPSQFAWLYYPDQMKQKKRDLEYAAQKLRYRAEDILAGKIDLPEGGE